MRRTLQSIPLLLAISVILYGILYNMPGGPLAPYLQNPHITAADIARLKHNLGMDQPVPIQYLKWLGHVLVGDMGYSTSNSEPVFQALIERFPATLELMGASLAVAILIGIGAGIISAVYRYSALDYAITTLAFFGQAMPVFWFALMMQLAFAVHGIPLPMGYVIQAAVGRHIQRRHVRSRRPSRALDLLPAAVLSILGIATFSRFMRSSLLEVLGTDYMRTAAAKGLSFRAILFRHGLKNAFIPVVTVIALSLPGLIAGAIFTETIFAWPGMGRLFINALNQSDLALLMGYLLMVAFLVVFSNLLADVVYAWLDPRVKYD